MAPNPGHLPTKAIGKRVRVLLADGTTNRDVDPSAPPGWPADGKGGCRWTLTGRPHDIAKFEVIA